MTDLTSGALGTIDRFLFPDEPRFHHGELIDLAGVDPRHGRALWRAMGFPDTADEEVAFDDEDLTALCRTAGGRRSLADEQAALRQTRVVSAAMATIAEQATDQLVDQTLRLSELGVAGDEIDEHLIASIDVDQYREFLWYMFRRQLRASLRRRLISDAASDRHVVIGFVDLVGFAPMSQHLANNDLEALVARFADLTYDAVAAAGGRVVKSIGDAVMFVADEPTAATTMAVELLAAIESDRLLPAARGGLSFGPVLARDGDYFGPTVNLAARIVNVAQSSTVAVANSLTSKIDAGIGLVLHALPPTELKGIGRQRLWRVSRTDRNAPSDRWTEQKRRLAAYST